MKKKPDCPFGFTDCEQVRMIAYNNGKHFVCSGIALKIDPAYDVIRICSKGSTVCEQQNWAVDEALALIDAVTSSVLQFSEEMMPIDLWRRKIVQAKKKCKQKKK